jgi:hypothetical protein
LHVPIAPITRARSKKIKEALNGLIQEIWGDSKIRHSKLGPKEDEGVVNLGIITPLVPRVGLNYESLPVV